MEAHIRMDIKRRVVIRNWGAPFRVVNQHHYMVV